MIICGTKKLLKGVVLDFDGTLVDSYDLHLKCWLETLQKFGFGSDRSRVTKHFGKSHTDMVHALAPGIKDELAMEIASTEKELFSDSKRELRLFPAVIEVLSEARRRGIKCAIASSNARADTKEMVESFGIDQFISAITGADEVDEGKPHPALIILAVERLAIDFDEGLVVGDTIHDVLAGTRAGMRTVLVVGKKMIHAQRYFSSEACADYLIPDIKYLTNVLDEE